MSIKVNDAEWAALSSEERKNVESIVKGFFKDATIVPDAATPRSKTERLEFFKNPVCSALCDVAEAAAVTACATLPNPIAIAACVAAAKAAGDECRNNC